MSVSLKDMSRAELEKLKARIAKQLERVTAAEKKTALAAAEKAVRAYGFSIEDLVGGAGEAAGKTKQARKSKPKVPSIAKYSNPADPTQTWTGKGRQPEWFKVQIAAGKTPDDLAI